MAIKNRFYKTTQGVPFELAIGKTLAPQATVKDLVTSGALYDIAAFIVDGIAAQPKTVPFGAPIPAADIKKPFFLSFVEKKDAATNQAIISSVTPLIASTIRAELVAYKAPTKQVTNIVLTAGTISTQQVLNFKLVETTPGNQPLPVWDYEEVLIPGATAVWAKIAAKINLQQDGEFFTATALPTGIGITSTDPNRHFKLVAVVTPTRADYNDYGVVYTATTTTPASAGSGTVEQLLELQKEANVRRGIGHYYTDKISFGTTANEFGLPVDVVTGSGTLTWDIVVLTGTKIEHSPTPVETHHNKHYIFVAVPAGQGASIVAMFA
jgi:hypothetical protein